MKSTTYGLKSLGGKTAVVKCQRKPLRGKINVFKCITMQSTLGALRNGFLRNVNTFLFSLNLIVLAIHTHIIYYILYYIYIYIYIYILGLP